MARFVWRAETIVPAVGVPPEFTEGLTTMLRVLVAPAAQDSFRIRVAGIDSNGIQGGWSEWGRYSDNDTFKIGG